MPYHNGSIDARISIESFTTITIEFRSCEFTYNSIDLACIFKYDNSCLNTTDIRLIMLTT